MFPAFLREKIPFYAYVHRGYWIDIGTPEKYLKAHRDLLSGEAKLKGFDSKPGAIYIDPAASVDDDSRISGPAFVRSRHNGKARSSHRALRGGWKQLSHRGGGTLADSVLWSNVRVGEEARVHGALVGRNTHIGRHALVDRGVVLGDKSVVADFSRLGHPEG